MRYYEVWVAALNYHGSEALTYSSEEELTKGSVVEVPLQNKYVVGVINKETVKPAFNTKPLRKSDTTAIIPPQSLELLLWLKDYYPAPSGQITSLFIPSNVATKSRLKPPTPKQSTSTVLPQITQEQKDALDIINNARKPCLLHGDTGTGKTRVYIELVRKQIESGKSAIVLTPEIGLTPQIVASFVSQFPDSVVVIHSHLTIAQRRDNWLRIAERKKPLIVIGPRSALFSPLSNIGTIIVDECHDGAYKQEQAPHYVTTRVAATLAKLHDAQLLLGSATPDIADYYAFEAKQLPIIRMTKPATQHTMPLNDIGIVAIRDRTQFTRSAWLSDIMIKSIWSSLNNGNQSLLFLNRRGSARVVLCQKCGWQSLCPHCDIPLTYHGDMHLLRCHTCGLKTHSPTSCPDCGAIEIVYRGIGTKALKEEVARLFPEARIARFDSDNTKSERLDQNDQQIRDGEVDILIGTQTVTKGLDLPKLAFVGVVAADSALNFPDFSSEEISYQQLSQVIGRVGRGHTEGSAIIQTYYPENPGIKAVVDKNYSLFYSQQILEREKFLFPPFSYLLKLNCSAKNSNTAENNCLKLRTKINNLHLPIEIVGPAPSFKHKQNNQYTWQLVIKSKKRTLLTDIIRQLPATFSYDIDPINLL